MGPEEMVGGVMKAFCEGQMREGGLPGGAVDKNLRQCRDTGLIPALGRSLAPQETATEHYSD